MSIDRTTAPEFHTIGSIDIPRAERVKLSAGNDLWLLDAGTQDVLRLDFIFNAGSRFQQKTLVASGVNEMLDEGTAQRSAEEIAEELDYFGAFIESEPGKDTSSFTVFTMNRHLEPVMKIVSEILCGASFPENEFRVYIDNKKQKFIVDSDKVSVLARRKFGEIIFGEKNPYGAAVKLTDFDAIGRKDLDAFHKTFYAKENCTIVASGKIPQGLEALLEKYPAGNPGKKAAADDFAPFSPSAERIHTVEKAGAIQSAIRMGRPLFNKTHPDYHAMLVLNTVLGGYFGSRLMSNIREDKGYTYGIGSGIMSMYNAGYFVISTEVGAEVTNAALEEIYSEIARLQNDLIPEEELELVRNYMTGVFLRSTDGPFALGDRLKGLLGYGLGYDYYERYLETIRSVSANELRELAQKYLRKEDIFELVAGVRK
ncbi:MAG TPA: pitrilysin family protein [Bacteroidia bacterium]|nr:pitrilysin family protein [Bacteroidia bacterium]